MKKHTIVYKQRRDVLSKLLIQYFSEIATWKIPAGGLAIWLQFNQQISLVKLASVAEKNDLFISKTVLYQNKKKCAIRFGFGHLDIKELEIVIVKLRSAYNTVIKN